jgi:hypothetical protein
MIVDEILAEEAKLCIPASTEKQLDDIYGNAIKALT